MTGSAGRSGFSALGVGLCSWLMVSTSVAAVALVSVEEEIEIGRSANEQLRKQLPELRDGTVAAYVRSVGTRLVRSGPGARYPYSFSVADLPEINALSLPGGPVWINRGVLSSSGNESQVAAVLAHEVAHIAMRHGADRLTQGMVAKWGLGLLGALLGNSGGAGVAQAAASVLAGGAMLTFNRSEEREADQVGTTILTRSGWSGRGMVELFEMLDREAARDRGSAAEFLSSHPSARDRIDNLTALVSRHRGGTRDSTRYRSIKAHLARLPSPRPKENH
jgi:predicted Zn-dependent protease